VQENTDKIKKKQPLLAVKDLKVNYGTFEAVRGVSFSVVAGEIFGLLGPNGAGKTTTLSAIEDLVKPASGSITVLGETVDDKPSIKAQMGVQLQSTSFQPELTVQEIIQLYSGLYGKELSMEDIRGALRSIELEDQAQKHLSELSGGQQQRVSLLITTLHDPAVVLLDEPTTGLDPQSRRQLWKKVEDLRDKGRGIVLTTHSMEEAQAVCDRIAIIDHGQTIASGTPTELIAEYSHDPRVKEVAHGNITLEDVFIGLTGSAIRE